MHTSASSDRRNDRRSAVAKISVNETYSANASEVWKKLSDFGGLAGWMPGVKSCEVKGEGIGAVRTLMMGPMKVVEKLESFDPDGRSLSYSLIEGPMALPNFLATIRVTETNPSGCRVEWSAAFDLPEGVSEQQIAPGLEGGYGGGLKALKSVVDC
jgi:carbon monoxide dehydrogenase subunit G